jgi:hypothetical protein
MQDGWAGAACGYAAFGQACRGWSRQPAEDAFEMSEQHFDLFPLAA